MKENKGITLVALIITVIILMMLAGVMISSMDDTYEKSQAIQFSSYMKMIQKKVDFYLEDGTDFKTLGQTLPTDKRSKLQDIINADTQNLIETTDLNSDNLRYFNSMDIEKYFEVSNINDEIVVNFANREVISLNGVERDGIMYYVENL